MLDALKAGAQPTTVGAVTQQARAAVLMRRARRAAGAQHAASPYLWLDLLCLRTYGCVADECKVCLKKCEGCPKTVSMSYSA